jgi:hypothetical protein
MKPEFNEDSSVTARREHEELIQRLLSDATKREALAWLKGGTTAEKRTVGACKTTRESLQLIQTIFDLGAVDIFAVQIHPIPRGGGEHTGKLVVKLPQDAKLRTAIFDWCKQQGDSLGFSPDPDGGESHLFLLLD